MNTEDAYLHSNDFKVVLAPLQRIYSSRKWRLFAIACIHRIWSMVPEPFQHAVEVAERFADRQASEKERAAACPRYSPHATAAEHAAFRAAGPKSQIIKLAQKAVPKYAAQAEMGYWSEAAERAAWPMYIRLLREVFGNPFRPASLDPAWQTVTVKALAEAAYLERDCPAYTLNNVRLAVLADALEEVGCTNTDILNHCRQPGVHVRGCWVVDLCLGRT
jgi:hypothetical protein